MSKGNTFENDWMKLVFNATPIANIADNAVSSPLTNIYVRLHTADPGEGGAGNASEVTYTGYAAIAVARTSGGWTVTNNQAENAALIQFGLCTVGTGTITHVSANVAASGATKILYSLALTASIAFAPGTQPEFPIGTLIFTED